jgi:hypothetical protein
MLPHVLKMINKVLKSMTLVRRIPAITDCGTSICDCIAAPLPRKEGSFPHPEKEDQNSIAAPNAADKEINSSSKP